MKPTNTSNVDVRQMAFDLMFEQEAPLGAMLNPESIVIVTLPRVVMDDPLPAPEKVKSVFDLFFSKDSQRLPVQSDQALPTFVQEKINPDEFPNTGTSNYNWTEDEVRLMHLGMLDHYIGNLGRKPVKSRETKLEALEWIFGEPKIHSYKCVWRLGREVRTSVLTQSIPFTFYCACHLTGHDAEAIQTSIQASLLAAGESDLLDHI